MPSDGFITRTAALVVAMRYFVVCGSTVARSSGSVLPASVVNPPTRVKEFEMTSSFLCSVPAYGGLVNSFIMHGRRLWASILNEHEHGTLLSRSSSQRKQSNLVVFIHHTYVQVP